MELRLEKLNYTVKTGENLTAEISDELSRCFVITDSNVYALYKDSLDLKNAYVINAGENSKSLSEVEKIAAAMLNAGCGRNTTVLALGGGVVGDLAGFIAAVYMRGTSVIQVPTTLLSMCDSSIGGKTGVNLPNAKNAIGAFFQPAKVLISFHFLETLDEREIRCGLGEIIKTALLKKEIFDFVESNIDNFLIDKNILYQAAEMCAVFKSNIVERDEKESFLRKILNVGHTIGHALESLGEYKLSHGEYVLHGIYHEMRVAREQIDNDFYKRVDRILKKLITPYAVDAEKIAEISLYDKKNSGQGISIILPIKAGETKEIFFSKSELAEALK